MFSGNNGYSLSDVAAVTGGNRNGNNGNGLFGDGGAWIIIILFLFVFLGWGNRGFGNNDGGGGSSMPTYIPIPASVGSGSGTQMEVQRGFDNAAVITKLDGINSGLCDGFYAVNSAILNAQSGVQNSLCQGFNSVNTNIMQGNFGLQQAINNATVANMQGQNALQAQLSNCCCETREAIQGVNYNMATNTCAITNQMNNNTRDIIESQNAGTRAILDYLCNDKISTLQNENQALRLAASQANQNAAIGAMIDASTANIIRRTGNDCPIPAYVVPNPNCCYNPTVAFNSGCGCGNGCGCA